MLRSLVLFCSFTTLVLGAGRSSSEITEAVERAMAQTQAKGMAIAVIEEGEVRHVSAHGVRNEKGDPLRTDTVMYGASLTKTVIAYMVLQLVDAGKLTLDTPLSSLLPRPAPTYEPDPRYADWRPLAGDVRWEKITPRIVLTHSTGFANFGFLEPDKKLRIHFEPGSRYAYSGDGFQFLQFAIEQGLGLDVGELTRQQFERLGMSRTSLIWRPDFAENLADGWDDQGRIEAHDERSKVRAAGSMDTTIADLARFAAALVRGDGLSHHARRELARPQLAITTANQFPTLAPELPLDARRKDLAAGLGVVVFHGPQGPGFFKGGHNGTTANTFVCLEDSKNAVLILSNDVRAEAAFAELIRFILGETGVPYAWEYGDRAGTS